MTGKSDFNSGVTQPFPHDSSYHLGATANLLAALTPTFSAAWTQQPAPYSKMVDESDTTVLTTAGISGGGAMITWDLGTIRRRIFQAFSDNLNYEIAYSVDGITWFIKNITGSGAVRTGVFTIVARFRYVAFAAYAGAGRTYNNLNFVCYNIN